MDSMSGSAAAALVARSAVADATSDQYPTWHKAVGISLALGSAFLIGSSFVIKKRGLLDSNIADNKRPGEGHGYLKNPLWWFGLILMLLGELCNVAAYAFSPAILVTPLGAVSVVVSAVMSDLFLKERLNFSAKIGCAQCMLGAVLLVINAPASNTTTTLDSFWTLAGAPVFIIYFSINVMLLTVLVIYCSPRWGERYPLVYIGICSILGSFVVVAMQGLGSAVVYSFANPNDTQFKNWSLYPLLIAVCLSGVMQINYLNKALNIFSTAIVTPVYYVFFTTATLVCSAILLRDFMFDTAVNGVSALVGFFVIVGGVSLLFAYSLQLIKEEDGMRLRTRSSSLSGSPASTVSDDAPPQHQQQPQQSSPPARSSILATVNGAASTLARNISSASTRSVSLAIDMPRRPMSLLSNSGASEDVALYSSGGGPGSAGAGTLGSRAGRARKDSETGLLGLAAPIAGSEMEIDVLDDGKGGFY